MTFSIPTLDEEVWRTTEPVDRAPAPAAAGAEGSSSTRAIKASVGMAPILPGHLRPTRAAARRSFAPRARPARPGSGRTCSSCARGRASTSSSASRDDWPEQLPLLRASSTPAARLPRRRADEADPRAGRRARAASTGSAIAGTRRSSPPAARTAGARDLVPTDPSRLTIRSRSWKPPRLRHRPPARDHVPDRRRPRGRPRRAAAVALARAAHPRDRRGLRRRERRRARRAAAAGRRDHGRAHARAWTGSRRRRS